MNTNLKVTGTLAAATATDVLLEQGVAPPSSTGLDVCQNSKVSVTVINTGANPITALAVYFTDDPTGANWPVADTDLVPSPSTIAPGTAQSFGVTDLCTQRMRLQLTSALGTTYQVNFTGKPLASGVL